MDDDVTLTPPESGDGDGSNWKRRYVFNTISAYATFVLRVGLGLVLFRLLFSRFDNVEFGFWALLWSLFGFAALVDFGLGLSVQKAVAQQADAKDFSGLSPLLSSVFWAFAGIGVGMFLLSIPARPLMFAAIHVPPEYVAEFSRAWFVFFAGMALILPTGLFPVMLEGMQRMDLANWFRIGTTIIHFCCMLWAISSDQSFAMIMFISAIAGSAPNLIAGSTVLKKMRGLSLSPRHFGLHHIKGQLAFSISAYLITCSTLVLTRTDQAVVATVVSISAVAIYQAGYKIGEMLIFFSQQISRAVTPAAAFLSGRNNTKELRELLLRTSRLMFLIVTPCYLISAFYLDALIRLLTGLEEVPREAWLVGQILLLAVFNSQITSGCARNVLVMSGHEKLLLKITMGQAIANLVLSVAFAFRFGIVGVATATLITSLLFNWGWLMPKLFQFTEMKPLRYIGYHASAAGLPFGVFALAAALILLLAPMSPESTFIDLAWRGLLILGPCMVLNLRRFKEILS